MFLGPTTNIDPLLLILQDDRQTINVVLENAVVDASQYLEE
jgi:hypothetical protein